jgi:hypothetical protein
MTGQISKPRSARALLRYRRYTAPWRPSWRSEPPTQNAVKTASSSLAKSANFSVLEPDLNVHPVDVRFFVGIGFDGLWNRKVTVALFLALWSRYRDDLAARRTLVNQNQRVKSDSRKFADNRHFTSALLADWRRRTHGACCASEPSWRLARNRQCRCSRRHGKTP